MNETEISESTIKDYEVTIRIRNNWMLKAMRKAGIENGAELSRRSGVPYTSIVSYLTLQKAFLRKDGRWASGVEDIAGFLSCNPEDLVPPQHMREALAKNRGVFEASMEEVGQIVDHRDQADPLLLIECRERRKAISDAMLLRLTSRERVVMTCLYGLDGKGERTLEQIATMIGLSSRERVRQLQLKAIRKLRLGTRNRPLGDVEDAKSRSQGRHAANIMRDFA